MADLVTVRVVHPDDPTRYMIINQRDYRPGVHTLWEERSSANGPGSQPSTETTGKPEGEPKAERAPAAKASAQDPAKPAAQPKAGAAKKGG